MGSPGANDSEPLRVRVLGTLAAWVIRVLFRTLRWSTEGFDPADRAWSPDHAKIFAFWHGRMVMLPPHFVRVRRGRQRPAYMLISRHADGRIIARAVESMGISTVAGSSTRGGAAALKLLVKLARDGADLGITPDGPKGPPQVCKQGVAAIAQLTGNPLYPVAFSAERCWRLGSWDRMMIPRPFSRAVALIGDSITIAPDGDLEAARVTIERSLNELTTKADNFWSTLP